EKRRRQMAVGSRQKEEDKAMSFWAGWKPTPHFGRHSLPYLLPHRVGCAGGGTGGGIAVVAGSFLPGGIDHRLDFVVGGNEFHEALEFLSGNRGKSVDLTEPRSGPLSELRIVVFLGDPRVVVARCPVLLAAVVILGPVKELLRFAIADLR